MAALTSPPMALSCSPRTQIKANSILSTGYLHQLDLRRIHLLLSSVFQLTPPCFVMLRFISQITHGYSIDSLVLDTGWCRIDVLSFLTLAPNVFDPVIAWTYFNPYLSGVPYGNPLNISDRYIFLRMQLLGWGQSATLLTV